MYDGFRLAYDKCMTISYPASIPAYDNCMTAQDLTDWLQIIATVSFFCAVISAVGKTLKDLIESMKNDDENNT